MEVYCGREVTKGEDVKAVNANFRLFGNWATPDFDSSECWKAMASMETILHLDDGKTFSYLLKKVPQYGLNLIVELQDLATAYTNIGNVSQYRDAVHQGIPLHPAPYQTANQLAQEVSGQFHLTVSRSKMEAYEGVPRVALVLPHLGMYMPLFGITFWTQARAKPF